MRAPVAILILLAACGPNPGGPSDPKPATAWTVSTDTTPIAGTAAKVVVISTEARDSSAKARLMAGCSYSYGDAVADGLPIMRSVTFSVDDRQLPANPLIVTGWRPTSGPSLYWNVGSFRLGGSLDAADVAEFWSAVPSHEEFRLWWSDGVLVERPFDVRNLGAALATIDARCHR